jgi:hypothetical protein
MKEVKVLRTLAEITSSIIDSYNNNERPNYVDIRDLHILSQHDIINND